MGSEPRVIPGVWLRGLIGSATGHGDTEPANFWPPQSTWPPNKQGSPPPGEAGKKSQTVFIWRSQACPHSLQWGAKDKIFIYIVKVNLSKSELLKGQKNFNRSVIISSLRLLPI
jgi:hypothetical protein